MKLVSWNWKKHDMTCVFVDKIYHVIIYNMHVTIENMWFCYDMYEMNMKCSCLSEIKTNEKNPYPVRLTSYFSLSDSSANFHMGFWRAGGLLC